MTGIPELDEMMAAAERQRRRDSHLIVLIAGVLCFLALVAIFGCDRPQKVAALRSVCALDLAAAEARFDECQEHIRQLESGGPAGCRVWHGCGRPNIPEDWCPVPTQGTTWSWCATPGPEARGHGGVAVELDARGGAA